MPSGWRKRVARPRAIWIILLAYLGLATIYNVTVPLFEAPDEYHHFFYVKHLADGNGLPVQSPDQKALWAQEGSQPPLYYALAALVISWIDTSDAHELLWFNLHANIGNPMQPGNKNRFVHWARERWPYRGTVLAVHLARLLSTILGAGTVYLTYRLARELLPGRTTIAYGAAALVAFTPQFDFIHAAVSNDAAIVFLATLTLWWLVRVLQGQDGWIDLALGVTLGLAALAKLSGLFLWLLAAVILVARAGMNHRWRRLWRDGALIFGTALAISAWWYVRNWRLYGDPTGLNVMLQIVGSRQPPPTLAQLGREFEGLRISFWALFGWFNVLVPTWIYRVLDAIGLVAIGGLLLGLWRQGMTPIPRRVWLLTLPAGWLALLLAGLVRWTSLTPGTQGRLLFPAISAVMLLLALGWCQWVSRPWRRYWMGALALFMFLFALACPFGVIRPAYARPAYITLDEVPAAARMSPVTHGDRIQVVGAELEREDVRPGEVLWLTVYWKTLAWFRRDYSVFVHVLTPDGRVIGQVDTWPGMGTLPTRLLRPGTVLPDRYPVPIRYDAPAPTIARVEVGLFDRRTKQGVPTFDVNGNQVDNIVGWIRVLPWERPRADPLEPLDFRLGNVIALDGFELSVAQVRPGETLTVTLYWRAIAPINRDFTVFTHLEDDRRVVIAQHDKPPLDGLWPTSAWEPEWPVVDRYTLRVPEGTLPGRYPLLVGMYSLEDGMRLPVSPVTDAVVDNAIRIATVEVVR